MTLIRHIILTTITACILLVFSCKKDKNQQASIPEITTTAITNITAITAIGGGTIKSNGGETIVASGICWSTTNQIPTVSDDSTKGSIASGSFTAVLNELNSSSTYYVRAYATNRVGTGYGNVVSFNTGNGAPAATSLSITGDAAVNSKLTAIYIYSDAEADPEGGTTFKWYLANDANGAGETEITGATDSTYTVLEEQEGKYIRVGVTAKSSAGNMTGVEVKSAFIGAIGEATTIRFIYNGTEVTYGILTSAATGKKWLDRSLGATRTAQSVDDYLAYGDLFQWGRLADGHQLMTRTGGNDGDATGVNGITATTSPYQTSSTDVPTTNKFIIDGGLNGDWRSPQSNNLWQGVDGVNNPCPTGWRIPTKDEWAAEAISSGTDAFTKLRLTYSGFREVASGNIVFSTYGVYWSSTIDETFSPQLFSANILFDASSYFPDATNRGNGIACRCIKE